MTKSNRGPGRPPVFVGYLEKQIVSLLARHGRQETQNILASEGVQTRPGVGKQVISVSLPTLTKLSHRNRVA